MYKNSAGQTITLGNAIGKGAAAVVYHHGLDKSQAIKIFKPEYLLKEHTLPKRLELLKKLSDNAMLYANFGKLQRPIGSWPKETIYDRTGKLVGYSMDTFRNGIDLSQVIFARDSTTAFYKHRNESYYNHWINTFLYHPNLLKNRFLLCYYLSVYFEKIYDLKNRNGQSIDLELCNFDVKPNNILVSIEVLSGQKYICPYILDLDNLTLKNESGTLSPVHPQITPEYKAPEGPVDKYYDYYSIAVIFYQLLFNIHPFMGIQGGTRFTDGTEMDFFVRNKCFPWGRNRKFLSKTTQDNIQHRNFTKISPALQQLFIRAFDSDIPNKRPEMKEWNAAFHQMISNQPSGFSNLFSFP